jgi:hypothetical protein
MHGDIYKVNQISLDQCILRKSTCLYYMYNQRLPYSHAQTP